MDASDFERQLRELVDATEFGRLENVVLEIEVTAENRGILEEHRRWLIEHGYGDPVVVEGV